MSDKTNDEKLRILQERLAQIKQKGDIPSNTQEKPQEKVIQDTNTNEFNQERKNPMSFKWLKYIAIIVVVYGIFYSYNNIKFKSLEPEKSNTEEGIVEEILQYNLNLKGEYIAIAATFENESSAKAMVNNLKVRGFKTDYFYLPENSNKSDKLYKVFIGPYENEQETNQWIRNLDIEVSLVGLRDGSIVRTIKSEAQIKIEKERIAREKAKKEEMAIEEAKRKRIALENAEKERITKEKAEEEELAKQIQKEKIAKEEAKKKRIESEQEELASTSDKLKKEIAELEKTKKRLLQKKSEITINYSYKFTLTMEDEGVLTIDNNAGYPKIKQIFSNIEEQGGQENIIENIKNTMNANGILIDNIYFEKNGNKTPPYKGDITLVYY